MQKQTTLFVGAVLGGLAVILGASGAHALKPALELSGKLSTFELANRYHFYHALALVLCGLIMTSNTSRLLRYASTSLLVGVTLFSGSLYLMCFYKISLLGPITPIGGVFLIAGWTLLAIGTIKK